MPGMSGARVTGFRQFFGYEKPKPNRGDSRTRQSRVAHEYKVWGGWVLSELLCRRDAKAGPGRASHSSPKKDLILDTVHNAPH